MSRSAYMLHWTSEMAQRPRTMMVVQEVCTWMRVLDDVMMRIRTATYSTNLNDIDTT